MRALMMATAALMATGGTLAYAQDASNNDQATPGAQSASMAYVTAAGQSDQFEIQEGKMAESMGQSAKVRRFGRQMVADHMKSTRDIMGAAMASGMPSMAPPPLSADQQQMIAQLQATSGAAFDRTYVQQQMQSHQMALQVQQGYAQSGTDPNLKGAATKIVPVVEHHIQELQTMQSAM